MKTADTDRTLEETAEESEAGLRTQSTPDVGSEVTEAGPKRRKIWRRLAIGFGLVVVLLLALYLSVTISPAPENSFWVERNEAVMPVWVEGNIESGVFVIFNHGGPGSSGTLESIIEANPGDACPSWPSPLKALEDDYAVVYWDQRHSGLSKGDVDPNDSHLCDPRPSLPPAHRLPHRNRDPGRSHLRCVPHH